MKPPRRLAPPILAMLCLGGCKTPIALDLHTSDLQAASKGTPTVTHATISADMVSMEKCAEHHDAVATAMAAGFQGIAFLTCRRGDATAFADIQVEIPATRAKIEPTAALALWVEKTPLGTGVVMKRNQAKIEAIVAALPKDIADNVHGAFEPLVTLTVQNDETDPVPISAQGVFVDGEPYQLPATFTLQRRDKLSITLSSVGNAALMGDGALLFWLK